jgi:hypothetical protein
MSLRAFHLLFIALSVVLSAFMAAWGASQYQATHQGGFIAVAATAMATAAGLALYGAAFRRKTRRFV